MTQGEREAAAALRAAIEALETSSRAFLHARLEARFCFEGAFDALTLARNLTRCVLVFVEDVG